MEKEIIFTENPEQDLWNYLLKYTYKSHILKYFSENNINIGENEEIICEIISSSIIQAFEYYKLSKEASLNVSPLLLYYGTVNLVLGVTTLKSGKLLNIKDHGMKVISNSDKKIGSTKIHFLDSNNGGLHLFLNQLGENVKLTQMNDWELSEILLSIPDINQEAVQCYDDLSTYCLPIQELITENETIEIIEFKHKTEKEVQEIINQIPKFTESYLRPNLYNKSDCVTAILRHKFLRQSIAIESCNNQLFLQIGHKKNNDLTVLSQWVYMYIGLFVLCSLCRYYPNKWNPFLRLDESGEKLLIEKFLQHARRMLPNIFLSLLLNKDCKFENKKYKPENRIKILGEHEIKDLIYSELLKKGEIKQ